MSYPRPPELDRDRLRQVRRARAQVLVDLAEGRAGLWATLMRGASDTVVAKMSLPKILATCLGRPRAQRVVKGLGRVYPSVRAGKKVAVSWLFREGAGPGRVLTLAVLLEDVEIGPPYPGWPWADLDREVVFVKERFDE